MKISQLHKQGRPVISFEVFPPQRDGSLEGLFATIGELKTLKPDFISVTYGAGGSTRQKTYEIAVRLKEMGILPLVHLTCVGQTSSDIGALLDKLAAAGIENILALRGDPPRGETNFKPVEGGFRYGSELVAFIRSRWDFCVGVAGYPETHPEAKSPAQDLDALKRKADAGADFITTQLFFENSLYTAYLEKLGALGIRVPVVPGIMPVLDAKSLARFGDFGAKVPWALAQGFLALSDNTEKARAFGLGYAVEQCRGLLALGAPGLHLYTMNKGAAAIEIFRQLFPK